MILLSPGKKEALKRGFHGPHHCLFHVVLQEAERRHGLFVQLWGPGKEAWEGVLVQNERKGTKGGMTPSGSSRGGR